MYILYTYIHVCICIHLLYNTLGDIGGMSAYMEFGEEKEKLYSLKIM